jgi:ABC-2 type transport system permease protein
MAGGWDATAMTWVLASGAMMTAVFGALTMRLYNRR